VRRRKTGRFEAVFKLKYLGTFDTIAEAAAAYRKARVA
jgi:AP2 domain